MNTSTLAGKGLAAISAYLLLLCTALWAPPLQARLLQVGNCADSGPGSLRNAVAVAASGDRIGFQQLACNAIVLTSGQIEMPQADLTLVGNRKVTVDGNGASRVFRHTGAGTLRVESLGVANGYVMGAFLSGACIFSDGRLELHHARVHHCVAVNRGGLDPEMRGAGVAAASVLVSHSQLFANGADVGGLGGAVYSDGRIRIYRSQLYDNVADIGGAVFSGRGHVEVVYSHLYGNHAAYFGGAINAWNNATINKSTISGNTANWYCGAVCLYGARTVIVDSTLSRNYAAYASVGNLWGDTTISNSTIAFNAETNPELCSGALSLEYGTGEPVRLHVESTILANNSCAGAAGFDIGGGVDFWGTHMITVIGANNLVGRSDPPLPADTILTDPRLAPLANNGGPTPTHALLGGSPAIDAGSNPLARLYDQRGPGFARARGQGPDIGAFESCGQLGPHDHAAPH